VKRITALILFLLCSVGLIIVYSGFEPPLEPADDQQRSEETQPEATGPAIPSDDRSGSSPVNLIPAEPDTDKNDGSDESEVMIYKPGTYKVGTDIPAGIYIAENDGSDISKVMIRDSLEPEKEKPNIIITARYMTTRGRFAERDNYIEAVSKGGGTPVMPQDDTELARLLRTGATEYAEILAERYDGLVLSGGGDVAAHFFNQEHHPASNTPDETLDKAELALALAFIKANKPVLGICRGMQIVNVALGGELIQDIPDLLGIDPGFHQDQQTRHPIDILPGTWLYEMFGPQANVNSTHHQCVTGIPEGFTLVAQAGPVIEAMVSGNILCVQFHPERMLDEGMLPLFEDFIMRCS